MTRSEIADLRRDFIDKRKEVLDRKLTALEKKIYDLIFNKIIANLEKEDGKILLNNKNLNIAAEIDKIFNQVNRSEYLDIIKSFGSDLTGVLSINQKYYDIIEDDKKKLEAITNQVDSLMKKRLGLKKDNTIVKEGYLDRLINDNPLKTKIKNATIKAVTSSSGYTEFNTQIKNIITGTDKVDGDLKRHFNTFAFDTYNSLNRTTSKLYAEKLSLTAFVYSGGKIDSSRCFCDKNNGKVFTTEESQKWKDLLNEDCGPIWNEDKDGAYEPLIEMGGYNCRHTADFISNSLAVRMRPDLKDSL